MESESDYIENKESMNPSPDLLLEKIKRRHDTALIFLKGGKYGGLNPEIKQELFSTLENWFEIVEGQKGELKFEEIAKRWGQGYLKYPGFKVMLENPQFNQEFINEGQQLLEQGKEQEFRQWLDQAKEIAKNDSGLLRLEVLIAYFASGGQNLLLKLKQGITRQGILKDLNLDAPENLEKAVGNERANLDWGSDDIPFQEFVKRIVVGSTTAMQAYPGSLRSIIARHLSEKKILPCVDLWEMTNDQWTAINNLTDSKTVASNLFNAIHAAGSFDELSLEINLLGDKDLESFDRSLSTL